MLGCSQPAISLYESGRRGRAPRPHIRRRIEAMFGLPAEQVLTPNEDGTDPKAGPAKSTTTTVGEHDEFYHC